MKARWLVLVALLAVVVVVGAVMRPSRKAQAAVESKMPVDRSLIDANTDFGFRLLKELVSESKGKNVFISPASVSLALSMTYNGANDTTKYAMAKTLAINGMSLQDLNKASAALLDNLNGPGPGVELSVANSLWARDGIDFRPDFMSRNREFYKAQVETLDFDSPSAVRTINSWVSDNTNRRIDQIVDQIDPQTILFLINAVYFKGEWKDKFDPADTKNADFTLLDGSKKQVRMMSNAEEFRYFDGTDFQAISLPYGGGRVSMYVFLPAKTSSLAAFCKKLNAPNWSKWMEEFTEFHIPVSLPKFTIEYSSSLAPALRVLGMGVAFDEAQAGFEAMTPVKPVWISEVKHKTFVEVNEKGTEAAAVTDVPMAAGIAMPAPDFIVDRPFFLAIRDNQTGAILFAGAITDPTAG